MKKNIVLSVIGLQLLIISFLGYKIYNKQKVLGAASVNPIKKESVSFPKDGEWKYFFEPVADTEDIEQAKVRPGAHYTINSDSLNEIRNYDTEKPEGTFRIIILGDSFTFGMLVSTKDNWTEQLEVKLNEIKCNATKSFEVINLGVRGYDIQYSVERYRRRGMKYNPDLVLWMIKEDDIYQINEILYQYVWNIDKQLIESGEKAKLQERGEYYPEWRIARDRMYSENGGKEGILAAQKANIRKLNEYYQGPLLMLMLGWEETSEIQFVKDFLNDRPSPSYYFDNIFSKGERYSSKYFAPGDGHANELGNMRIADSILNYLRKSEILSCFK